VHEKKKESWLQSSLEPIFIIHSRRGKQDWTTQDKKGSKGEKRGKKEENDFQGVLTVNSSLGRKRRDHGSDSRRRGRLLLVYIVFNGKASLYEAGEKAWKESRKS